MIKRKYNYYKIKVTYLNGETETIEYKEKDKKSYKQMLELYNDTKDHYKDESVIIDFCGISDDNEINVIFQKEIKGKDYEIKKEADELKESTADELVENLNKAISDILLKKTNLKNEVDILTKSRDAMLHELISNTYTDREKIKFFDEIQRKTIKRNSDKKEINILNTIETCNLTGLRKNVQSANRVIKTYEEFDRAVKKDCESIIDAQRVRVVTYQNYKQRDNLLKQMKHKYDRIMDDPSNMCLNCYNKCQSKKNKKRVKSIVKNINSK